MLRMMADPSEWFPTGFKSMHICIGLIEYGWYAVDNPELRNPCDGWGNACGSNQRTTHTDTPLLSVCIVAPTSPDVSGEQTNKCKSVEFLFVKCISYEIGGVEKMLNLVTFVIHCIEKNGFEVLIVGLRKDVWRWGGGCAKGRDRSDFRRGGCRGGVDTTRHFLVYSLGV